MTSRSTILLVHLLLLASWAPLKVVAAQAQSRITFTLPYGPYSVGFRDLQLHDSSRAVVDSDSSGERIAWRPRPIQVSMWYPAKPQPGVKPMPYREYVWLWSRPLTFASRTDAARAATERIYLNRFLLLTDRTTGWRAPRLAQLDSARQREFNAITHAFRDAPSSSGSFPLIIYAPGMGGASFENDILVEYLVSHGYVVLGSPSWGAGQRADLDRSTLEAQARDIEFLVGYGRGLAAAAGQRVGVIGHSFGGLANILVAHRSPVVDAVVSLDGTIRYIWQKNFIQDAFRAGSGIYTTPSLFLNQAANNDPEFYRAAGADSQFVFFDSLRFAPAWAVWMEKIDHQNFVAAFNRFSGKQRLNFVSDTSISNRGYEDIARIVLGFLDRQLKSAGGDWSPPTPRAGTTSPYTIRARVAHRPLPTAVSFGAAARANGGLVSAPSYLVRVRDANPSYSIPLPELSEFAWSFGSIAVRAALLEVAVTLHPDSIGPHNDLGDAYLEMADTVKAIRHFTRATQIDSTAAYAKDQLKRLRRLP